MWVCVNVGAVLTCIPCELGQTMGVWEHMVHCGQSMLTFQGPTLPYHSPINAMSVKLLSEPGFLLNITITGHQSVHIGVHCSCIGGNNKCKWIPNRSCCWNKDLHTFRQSQASCHLFLFTTKSFSHTPSILLPAFKDHHLWNYLIYQGMYVTFLFFFSS